MDQILQFVARHELQAQLPRSLYDSKNDEKAQAVRHDVLSAGRDDLFLVVVEEAAEDADVFRLARILRDKIGLVVFDMRRLVVFIRQTPEIRIDEERTEVESKPDAEHRLPKELLAILQAEGDHHACNRRHDDEDDVQCLERAGDERLEVLVKFPAKSRARLRDRCRLLAMRDKARACGETKARVRCCGCEENCEHKEELPLVYAANKLPNRFHNSSLF